MSAELIRELRRSSEIAYLGCRVSAELILELRRSSEIAYLLARIGSFGIAEPCLRRPCRRITTHWREPGGMLCDEHADEKSTALDDAPLRRRLERLMTEETP